MGDHPIVASKKNRRRVLMLSVGALAMLTAGGLVLVFAARVQEARDRTY